jgi:pimeloyl-ACP methyl ester carboxylesterase
LTLWGISYGTHLALATIKEYPASVDRAILAGLEPLRHTLKLPSDQQELLEEIGRLAAADPTVRNAIPDLVGSIARLLARLEREPASALLVDPTDGTAGEVAVGAADLRVVLANLLAGPESFRLIPDLVHRLEGGDWTALALLAVPDRMGEVPGLMTLAMDCASGASEDWLARIRREAPATLLRDAINFPGPEVCEGVPVADLGDDFRAPAGSEIPVLLISGTLDGRTPVRNGDFVAASFPDSGHLVIEGAGHSDPLFLSSPEILATMERFLAGETVGDRRIAAPPFRFVAPRKVVPLPAGAGERYAGSYRTPEGDVRLVVPAGPDVVYTIRRGRPLVLRPLSETEFFYEGTATRVEFELDGTGRATAMVLYTDGQPEGERSPRIE